MNLLEVTNLSTRYGGIAALNGVSLTIRQGSVVGIIGANGAGKTTLLNTISGLVKASAGSVTFEGTDLVNRAAYQISRLGLLQVPEGRRILAPLTVAENLSAGHSAAGRRGGAIADDMERVLSVFPRLRERINQPAGQLSGGEQQMLAIGRALMGRPKLLLLDEPSLGLAPLVVEQVFQTLETLHEGGLTIMMVEQNAKRALEVADYAYVLERGRVVHHGPSELLRDDPQLVSHYLGGKSAGSPHVSSMTTT